MLFRHPHNQGFSLFELIMVMFIIGLASALVIPRISGSMDSLEVRAAARKVMSAMRYARNIAVYNSSACQMVIDTKSGTLFVEKISYDSSVAGSTTFRADRLQEIELKGGIRLSVENYSGLDADNGIYQFLFSPSGSLRGGDVVVSGENNERERIILDPVNGLPRIDG